MTADRAPPARARRPVVERIGHRGASREFPENSLPAFERALALGADAVELDVHVTADGIPVVHHDADVRLHSGAGRAMRPITSLPWEDLSRIQIAPDLFVPSLEQVLELVGDRGSVYVELKGRGVEEHSIAVIRESKTSCAVHSFDHHSIVRASRVAPEISRGILFDEYPRDVVASMRECSARDVWPQWQLVDAALVDQVHREGGRVIAWTVNTTDAAEQLVRLKVDGLCGDDVRVFPNASPSG